jgi:uncharacterized membrane protein
MSFDSEASQINRLNFEDILIIIFIILGLINLYANNENKEYIKTKEKKHHTTANEAFLLTLTVTFFIYIYFFVRNYNDYKKIEESKKGLFLIKVLGSSFLIAGIICLIYFQQKQTSFVDSPAL